ncbi:alpha/beta hydrolase [Albimonas pacifica]|uniref:Uncharacterized protein n=1 Tax=Albimonas pacifica TaxID=1114924 RepID=A0A1I3HT09_9RHOB|nr:alpha/beta hydrolase [Albimonas pacifica]SFI38791.1 Alpha/beta hydrolase of unknown function [Albimonas pacifica]
MDPFAGLDARDYARLDELLYVTGRRPARTISVASVEEVGILPAGPTDLPAILPEDPAVAAAGDAFARRVDERLALSGRGDVFIFGHGCNGTFECPLPVSSAWRRDLGDAGAFIAVSWPAKPARLEAAARAWGG